MFERKLIIPEIHIHFDSVDGVLEKLSSVEETLRGLIMATKEEVAAAIAAEAEEVKAKVDALIAEIEELKARQIGATPEELDAILAGVQGIFTPAII